MEEKELEDKIVLCRITKINKSYFEVVTSIGERGIVYINEVSDYYVKNLNEIIQLNNVLYLVVKEYKDNKLFLSFKKNRSDFLKTPFEFTIKNTEKNFENLFNFTNEEIKKWKRLK